MKLPGFYKFLTISILFCLFSVKRVRAFSVFAHLAVIDASWKTSIVPLLKQRYPDATDAQLKEAHAYAYGGSLMPDMGYFPFGSVYFTNLVHYVRTGDFMTNLVRESQNIDEYAFALGAISHYFTDEYGHSLATNVVEPIVYPKVEKKYGKVVTYEEYPIYHSRMEFGFDVLQMARGNYASQAYHDFIGFEVAKPVLERAFLITYGEDLDSLLNGKLDLNIATFRWTVRTLLPGLTRTAWALKKSDIRKNEPGMTARRFHYRMRRREYYQKYGRDRERPNLRNRITAFLISILPKVGPLRALKFKPPGPEGEKLFIRAFDTSLVHYSIFLDKLRDKDKVSLKDMDFDTGKPTVYGEYGLADQSYSQLVIGLDKNKFEYTSSPLKKNILSFFSKADSSAEPPKKLFTWKDTNLALHELMRAKPVAAKHLKFPASADEVSSEAETGREQ
ncbi:MAG TPA: zinc dependent phospholipase C family protein [Mucilaginibacter sp.]|nr:zinc dependent phospholipase C family protein [Mucilaginibacter sp.]